jgi:exonuclease III
LWETLIPPYHQLIGHPNKKINEEIPELNHTINQMELGDIYRIFHPTSAEYTFFSTTHVTFSKLDHILGHKTSLSKYKKI